MRIEPITELTTAFPGFLTDPHPAYRALRAQGPVHRVKMPGGETVRLVLGYDAVRTALADPRLRNDIRHSAEFDDDGGYAIGLNMLQTDPPDHTRLRTLVAREFTARRIAHLRPRIEHICAELLDDMTADRADRADLVNDYAFPLPITVISELLGVPAADRAAFRGWSSDIVAVADAEKAGAAAVAMTGYLTGLIEDKRRQAPDEDGDLLHALVRTHDQDDHLTPEELLGMAFLLLVAGHETTANLISSAVHHLLRHPDQLAALRADPALVDGTVEEALRYEPPAQIAAYRYNAEPMTLAGTALDQGERVVLGLAAANRDPDRFADPDRFDIHRDPAVNRAQIAFSHGIHHCLGAPLARLETAIALPALLSRFPDLALDETADAPEWRPSLLRGLRNLPVRW